MKPALIVLLAVALTACGGKKTRPSTPDAPRPSHGAPQRPAPVTRSRPDKPGEYTAGGLYKPGVADGGPPIPPDIGHLIEPEPTGEPPARYGNRSPYTVLGKNYHVMDSAEGYLARGIASWYGSKFHGRATSSLEPYDMYQFSAAHKSLPLPSWARVTNLENGKSVVVRVNDRGPFHDNRLIDLSYAAAVRIGIWPKGTGLVEVRAIDPTRPEAAPAAPAAAAKAVSDPPRIYLQLGAFAERTNAERVERDLRAQRLGNVHIATVGVDGREIHRVRLGPLADIAAADAMSRRLERLGFGTPRVAIDD